MRSTSGMRPINGSTLPALAFSLRSTVNCLSALSFLPLSFSLFSSAPSGERGSARCRPCHSVADVGHRIEAAHVLLLEEIDGVALALGEEGDEDVGAGDFVAARRLNVEDRALDHALEPAGRSRVGRAVGDQRPELIVEILLHARAQVVAADSAGGHHLRRMLVVDQRDQQCSRVAYSCRRRLLHPRALWRVCSSSRANLRHLNITPCPPERNGL